MQKFTGILAVIALALAFHVMIPPSHALEQENLQIRKHVESLEDHANVHAEVAGWKLSQKKNERHLYSKSNGTISKGSKSKGSTGCPSGFRYELRCIENGMCEKQDAVPVMSCNPGEPLPFSDQCFDCECVCRDVGPGRRLGTGDETRNNHGGSIGSEETTKASKNAKPLHFDDAQD